MNGCPLPTVRPARGVSVARRQAVPCSALFGRKKDASKDSSAAPETSIADVEREVAALAADAPAQQQQQQQRGGSRGAPEASALAGQQQQSAAGSRQFSQQQRAGAPPHPPPQPAPLLPFLGVLAAAAATLGLAYRGAIGAAAGSALSAGAGAVGAGLQAKKLQREAAARLNQLSAVLQNSPSADLSAKNLGDEGAAYVVEALAFNTICVAANLSNNGIGRVGAAQLCEVLPTCRLETLVLSTNSIGDEGAELLAKRLGGDAKLSALDLGSNGIGDAGAAALAEGLKLNTTLTKLDLRWAPGAAGLAAFDCGPAGAAGRRRAGGAWRHRCSRAAGALWVVRGVRPPAPSHA
jgi:hypothetical protein